MHTSTSLFTAHTWLSWIYSSLLTSHTSSLKLTWLTLSHAENQDQSGSMFPHLSSSQTSSSTVLLMSSLKHIFPSAACAAERPVDERRTLVSTSPHPTQPQNSFHPYWSHATPSSSNPIMLPIPSTLHPPTELKLLPKPSFSITTDTSYLIKPCKPQSGQSISIWKSGYMTGKRP